MLAKEAADRLSLLCPGRHLLCIQDTTEVNLSAHQHRIDESTGVGRLDYSGYNLGFKLHPVFVVDAHSLTPLGFSHIHIFHRPLNKEDRHLRCYKRLPIHRKESYKWIRAAIKSKQALSQAASLTFIQDREADIYELLARIPDHNTHVIIRSSSNRHLEDQSKLWDQIARQKVSGNYQISLSTDYRRGRKAAIANLELRWLTCRIAKPHSALSTKVPYVEVCGIEVREHKPARGRKPVHWRLITTHKVTCFEDARTIVEWYCQRWLIEQLFRLLKKEGFRIEDCELESGWAIRKLSVLMLITALKVLQMRLCWNMEEGQPACEVFDKKQLACLGKLNATVEGSTAKLRNPFSEHSLRWAAWIIARLGGWTGYNSQGPPGPLVLKRGLDDFYLIFKGWMLERDVGTR